MAIVTSEKYILLKELFTQKFVENVLTLKP